ncbi:hypothetical protein PAXINDRAFT_170334 [Paxillus involutus ATCC 200175]|uniref:Uncharacterized protein n=1 Tax=Paxillus involutus ATCC 200175 TaxID=664439 RepID=A0A0C9SW18_PAXIN|nr:hypothetical protein PAXINDRAFT_170334 [Paxillus involutus ATCC 200175]
MKHSEKTVNAFKGRESGASEYLEAVQSRLLAPSGVVQHYGWMVRNSYGWVRRVSHSSGFTGCLDSSPTIGRRGDSAIVER